MPVKLTRSADGGYHVVRPTTEAAKKVVSTLLDGMDRYIKAAKIPEPGNREPGTLRLSYREITRLGEIRAYMPTQFQPEVDDRLMRLGIIDWWEGPDDPDSGVGISGDMYTGGEYHKLIPWLQQAWDEALEADRYARIRARRQAKRKVDDA